MVIAAADAAASAFTMTAIDVAHHPGLLIFGFGVHGLFVNSVQVPLYALCAFVYATEVRATGTAAGLAVGRGGGIVSSFVGALVITAGGAVGYLSAGNRLVSTPVPDCKGAEMTATFDPLCRRQGAQQGTRGQGR